MREKLLGLVSISLLVVAVCLYVFGSGDVANMLSGACMKSGAVLFALWLALPQLYQLHEKLPLWAFGVIAAALAVIAWRPRTALIVLPLLLVLGLLRFVGWLLAPPPSKRPAKPQPVADSREPPPRVKSSPSRGRSSG